MTRQSRAENGRRRLAILKRYGILVDASTELPAKLPPRSADPASENFKSWCQRVLGCDPTDVVVYAQSDIAPQMGMKRLREDSPSVGLAEVLVAQEEESKRSVEDQLARSKRKAAAKLAELTQSEAQLEAARSTLVQQTRASRPASIASELERWLDANPELDVIVRQRARALLAGLEQGRSVAAVIVEVLEFAQQCRKALLRTS